MVEKSVITARCESCEYFDDRSETHASACCRINPPTCSSDSVGRWPTVERDDWCGKFVASKAAIKAALST